jgi:hypothetical protein
MAGGMIKESEKSEKSKNEELTVALRAVLNDEESGGSHGCRRSMESTSCWGLKLGAIEEARTEGGRRRRERRSKRRRWGER